MLVGLSCHVPARVPDLLRQPRWGDQHATWQKPGLPPLGTMTHVRLIFFRFKGKNNSNRREQTGDVCVHPGCLCTLLLRYPQCVNNGETAWSTNGLQIIQEQEVKQFSHIVASVPEISGHHWSFS